MYHYQKNIGDYRSATMHLSLVEHGVYNQLLDWYYLDELPLPSDNRTLFRRLSARSEIEQQAVVDVLSEMFRQTEAGWVHKRVEREIAQYKAKADQAREAGKLGGRPSKKGIGYKNNRDGFEKEATAKPTANHEPLTINQEPITNTPSSEGVARTNEGAACIAMKSAGMASVNPANPKLTELLKAGITVSELADAASDAVSKGKSFAYALATAEGRRRDAATAPLPTVQRQQPKSFAERDRESGWARWEETTNRVHPDRIKADQKSGHVIDISPLNLEIAQ